MLLLPLVWKRKREGKKNQELIVKASDQCEAKGDRWLTEIERGRCLFASSHAASQRYVWCNLIGTLNGLFGDSLWWNVAPRKVWTYASIKTYGCYLKGHTAPKMEFSFWIASSTQLECFLCLFQSKISVVKCFSFMDDFYLSAGESQEPLHILLRLHFRYIRQTNGLESGSINVLKCTESPGGRLWGKSSHQNSLNTQ